jgi:kynurenine formamidase
MPHATSSTTSAAPTEEEVFALGAALRNWGRWGPDDEKGTLNHITPEARVRAASLVRRGAVFSLGLPIRDGEGPTRPYPVGRFHPTHRMTKIGNQRGPLEMGGTADFIDDVIMMGVQTGSHWDALCHIYYGGQLYNGYPASAVDDRGAHRDGVDKLHADLNGRGVLFDVPALFGRTTLDPGYAITAEDLDRCAEKQGVEVAKGDIAVIRTGAMTRVPEGGWDAFHAQPRPGLHFSTVSWLAEHEIAAVAADNTGIEAPSPVPTLRNPFHMIALRDMGLPLGEFWNLEELAADCADDGVYEFLLVAQGMPIVGGSGSPVNPLALK